MPAAVENHYNRAWMRTLLRVVLLIVVWGMLGGWGDSSAAQARRKQRIWGSRPLLPYIGLTASLEAPLRQGARLSPAEYAALRRIAWDESQTYRRLLEATTSIVSNPAITLSEKRRLIAAMGYNAQVDRLTYTFDLALRRALGREAYARVAGWAEGQFSVWRAQFGVQEQIGVHGVFMMLPAGSGALTPHTALRTPNNSPRSYKIYATRYDAKGRYTAALPDRCVKLTNGGSSTCAEHGYVAGQVYSIIMSYKDTIGVDVGETGPWNIDDTFWATAGDPTPRRMFADLALGMPEAQAAFYNGYNGGVDQYGRKVTAPFAIDLVFEVADDLGLPPKSNDWITVSFMWTEAWGGGGSGAAVVQPVETAAADEAGKVIHVVKSGQTLWNIAVSYGVTVDALKALNGLGEDGLIISGQKLVVKAGDQPAGGAPAASVTAGVDGETPTPVKDALAAPRSAQRTEAARGASAAEAAQITGATPATAASPAANPTEPAASGALVLAARTDPILLAIIVAVALGLGLVAWGTLARRE